MSKRITEDDIRARRAIPVLRGRYYRAEWAPPGTQQRIPMPEQGRES